MIIGIDSAKWQGKLPVFELEEAGIQFAVLKAGQGAYKNPDVAFKENFDRLSLTKVLKSAYWYFTDADPIVQAELFIKIVDRVQDCDLPLMIDFEDRTTVYKGRQLGDRLRTMQRRVRELSGQSKLFLYSYRPYIEEFLAGDDLSDIIVENYYWHAEYPRLLLQDARACGRLPPKIPEPKLPLAWVRAGVKATLHQFDGDGGCALPNGVDADFNVFHGSLEELRQLLPRYEVADTLPAPPSVRYYDTPSVPNALDVVTSDVILGDKKGE